MDLSGYPFQSPGSVISPVHSRHGGQQGLCRTNIGGGPFPFDMLFACLQGHTQSRIFMPVNRNPDDTAGEIPFEILSCGKICGMGAPVTHGNAKTLCGPDHHICPPISWWDKNGQAQKICSYPNKYVFGMGVRYKIMIVNNMAISSRVLKQGTKIFFIQ